MKEETAGGGRIKSTEGGVRRNCSVVLTKGIVLFFGFFLRRPVILFHFFFLSCF